MRGARRFFSRKKQVFLVGFSLTIPRFPRKSKNRLNTSLVIDTHKKQKLSHDLLQKLHEKEKISKTIQITINS